MASCIRTPKEGWMAAARVRAEAGSWAAPRPRAWHGACPAAGRRGEAGGSRQQSDQDDDNWSDGGGAGGRCRSWAWANVGEEEAVTEVIQ